MSDPIIRVEFPRVAYVGGAGVADHGALTGLADDDHTQYLTTTRGDARYSRTSHGHTQLAALDITTLRIAVGDGTFVRLVPVVVGGHASIQFALE